MVIATLDEKEKQTVVSQGALLHFGLGMWIRNQFGLWPENQALKNSCALAAAREAGCSPEVLADIEARLQVDDENPWHTYLRENRQAGSEPDRQIFHALMVSHDADGASGVIIKATVTRLQAGGTQTLGNEIE